MNISHLRGRLAARHRQNRTQRDLDRAIRNAPTLASREELLNLR